MENAKYILCYTREPQDDMIYSNRLAFSMHLAYSEDGKDFSALNHNSGVLFARATENEDKTLNAKSLKCPFIFSMEDGLYGVVAVRTDAEGENDIESKGKILFFTTADFLQYDEIGLIDLHTDNYVQDVACVYDPAAKKYLVYWRDEQQRWYRNETADMFSLEGSETNIHCEGIDIQSVGAGSQGAAVQSAGNAIQGAAVQSAGNAIQGAAVQSAGNAIQGAAVQSTGNAIQGAAVQSTGNAIRDAAVQNTGNAIWDAAVQSAGNAIQDAAVQVTGAEVQDAQTAINGIRADIEGIIPRNILKVPAHIGTRLKHKLTTPVNIRVEVPDEIVASSRDELDRVKARAIYSDGTVSEKVVDWHTGGVNWNRPGSYQIRGTVCQDHFEFPIAVNRADPCITKWNGRYYFIATNDADGNHTLYIREADSIPGLVDAEEILLLDSDTYPHVKGLLWAPEFHVIEGDLYIFHGACSDGFYYEESHLMKLRKGGNPANREDWSAPQRILRKDGSYLCEAGKEISLDMTVIRQNNVYYAVWSQRQFIPVDTGAWLYIARLNRDEPWKLETDPVVISKPDYGWANNHVFVDEGPYALITDKKIFLTFASALVDATYVIGLLTAEHGSDLLDPKSWTKQNYPLLTSRSVPGEYGPGHNSYVVDDNGIIWSAYHARPGVDGPRSSGIRRVHFDIDGYPVLDLTEDKDLDPRFRRVSTRLVVKG
jgi:GH43 family beta-xylosidase